MFGRIIKILEKVYTDKFELSPQLLSDFFEDVIRIKEFTNKVVQTAKEELQQLGRSQRLWRCLICWRLNKSPIIPDEFLVPGGLVFEQLKRIYRRNFDHKEIVVCQRIGVFEYNTFTDSFQTKHVFMQLCRFCDHIACQLRLQDLNGNIKFLDSDHTRTPSIESKCKRKMKHFWNGIEYDNPPLFFDLTYKSVQSPLTNLIWFRNESNPNYNSNAVALASHFIAVNYGSIEEGTELHNTVMNKVLDQIVMLIESAEENQCCDYCSCGDVLWNLKEFKCGRTEDDERKFYENLLNYEKEQLRPPQWKHRKSANK